MLPDWISVTSETWGPERLNPGLRQSGQSRVKIRAPTGCYELQTRPLRTLGSPGAPPPPVPWRLAGQSSPPLRCRKPGPQRPSFKLETSREVARDTRTGAPFGDSRAPQVLGSSAPSRPRGSSAPDPTPKFSSADPGPLPAVAAHALHRSCSS